MRSVSGIRVEVNPGSLKSSSYPAAGGGGLALEQDLILSDFKSCAQLLSLSQIVKSHQRTA